MSRHPNVINLDALPWTGTGREGTRFEAERKAVGRAGGADRLGVSAYRLAPGMRAFPVHCHYGNEEGLFILEGTGTALIGAEEVGVRAGDYVALPAGEDHAHQLHNTGEGPLVYLCVSTMNEPDVVGYPDSDKIGVFTGAAPGGPGARRQVSGFWRKDAAVAYLDGEET